MHLEIAAMPDKQRVGAGIIGHTVGQRIANRMGYAGRDIIDIVNGF